MQTLQVPCRLRCIAKNLSQRETWPLSLYNTASLEFCTCHMSKHQSYTILVWCNEQKNATAETTLSKHLDKSF